MKGTWLPEPKLLHQKSRVYDIVIITTGLVYITLYLLLSETTFPPMMSPVLYFKITGFSLLAYAVLIRIADYYSFTARKIIIVIYSLVWIVSFFTVLPLYSLFTIPNFIFVLWVHLTKAPEQKI